MAKNKNKLLDSYDPEQWETERDLEAICRAEAINGDPERMKKVKAHAKKMLDDSKAEKAIAEKKIEMAV